MSWVIVTPTNMVLGSSSVNFCCCSPSVHIEWSNVPVKGGLCMGKVASIEYRHPVGIPLPAWGSRTRVHSLPAESELCKECSVHLHFLCGSYFLFNVACSLIPPAFCFHARLMLAICGSGVFPIAWKEPVGSRGLQNIVPIKLCILSTCTYEYF